MAKDVARRWVLVNRQGEYYRNDSSGGFSKGLDEAYIYTGKPEERDQTLTPVSVLVAIEREGVTLH